MYIIFLLILNCLGSGRKHKLQKEKTVTILNKETSFHKEIKRLDISEHSSLYFSKFKGDLKVRFILDDRPIVSEGMKIKDGYTIELGKLIKKHKLDKTKFEYIHIEIEDVISKHIYIFSLYIK